jgi:arabinogalactan endo-1,4-beta-galactosidase
MLALVLLIVGVAEARTDFTIGADVSSLPQIEATGGTFKDHGRQADLLAILKTHGVNHIRLRIWNRPADGYCGLAQTLLMAKRLKQAGLPWLLDFHYADTWADPGHQPKPATWADLHGPALESAVYDWTRQVIAALDSQGTPPEMVQVGNEITAGFLWDDGRLGGKGHSPAEAEAKWNGFTGLLKAGIRGVNDGSAGREPIRVMVHIDRGADNPGSRWFFDHLRERSVQFDVIGLSYYPWWHGPLGKLKANLDDLSVRYEKDLIVVETAYPCSPKGVDPHWSKSEKLTATVDGQRDFLAALVRIVRGTAGGRGKGVYYWEPAWIPTPNARSMWFDRGLFDADGNLLDSIGGLTGK